jgi:cytochrome c oxidase subunit II
VNALDPAGPQAALIAAETWYLIAVMTVVFVLTAGALAIAIMRRGDDAQPPSRRNRGLAVTVGGALAVTVAVLIVNLVIDMRVAHALDHLSRGDALTIEIRGQQWWWEVEYVADDPSRRVTTANEIHIPVGEPVLLTLRALDVIHSFWVPQLHGKRDLIPGYTRSLWIQADEPGVYRGECAEFCGHQHAHMAFAVVAEPRAQFERWYEAQLGTAAAPAQGLASSGQDVFLGKSCPLCHAIRGTEASGRVGPELTHVASRTRIAAATLPNDDRALRAWILDPHAFKPGVRMPQNPLTSDELDALVAYLRGLQ